MSKILKCPLCKKDPKKVVPWLASQIDDAKELQTWPQYSCCGHISLGPVAWNKHVAAMEFSISVIEIHKTVKLSDEEHEKAAKKYEKADALLQEIFK